MKYLKQDLDTSDDSFSYTLLGESVPLYRVDSSGYLTKRGEQIGKFCLRDQHWDLILDDGSVFEGTQFGTFKLPEFELFVLSKLVNQP
jgi:hypothetical protein